MQRKYVSYEDVQKYIGEGNMLIFYEAMAEKMELYKKKKIKINFINYTLYMKYEERFIKNENVPITYDYLYEICNILGDDYFEKFLDFFSGTRLSVSYTHVRNAIICDELKKGNTVKDIAEKYKITTAYAYKIQKRYS